ncbi:MAG TPA: sigma-70 family RNA polymerase sigma factor [Terriglobales bacterium]|nr:sigma-70 family RNA polymerase sigma factor [Terriglobales bacterium]
MQSTLVEPAPNSSCAAVPDAAASDRCWEDALCAHTRLLYRIAYSVLRNHADAEDAVQETLHRAWRYRARFERIENPVAWLSRIAWRTAQDRRRHSPTVPLEDLDGLRQQRASGASADDLAAHHQMKRLVDELIRHLPRKLREPLLLSTVDELTVIEIAYMLRISPAAVRSRCLRARRLLREKLHATLNRPQSA